MLKVKSDFKEKSPQEVKNMNEEQLKKYLEEHAKYTKSVCKDLETTSRAIADFYQNFGARLARKIEYAYVSTEEGAKVLEELNKIFKDVVKLRSKYKI